MVRHPAGIEETCLVQGKTSSTNVRIEVFTVIKETHGEEKHSREELGFCLHRERKSEFFSLYTPPKAGTQFQPRGFADL